MSRTQDRPDCFAVMTNNKRMTRTEIAGFQSDFNVNLSECEEENGWFDVEFCEGLDLYEMDEQEFIANYVLGDDLND